MRRRCAGTLILAAESNSTSSPIAMRPRSGVTSPAIMLTMDVLPEPEGPNSAVTPPSVSNFAATEKSPRRFSTSTSMLLPVEPRTGAPREPFRHHERRERDHDGNDNEAQRGSIATGHLGISIDGRRDGLRLARDVGDERDRGTELAQRLGEAQHHAGDNSGERERQRHGEEHPGAVGTER